MAIGVESRVEAHWDKPPEKEVIHTGRKVYRPPLPSTYKKTELSDDLKNGTEWVFRDYVGSLKEAKEPLPPIDNAVEFDARNDVKELENNINCRDALVTFRKISKRWSLTNGIFF